PGVPGPSRFTLWWVILVALGLWNLWAFFPRQTTEATLPYSEFIAQLSAGNVTQVHISGETISGNFQHPILWPTPNASNTGGQSTNSAHSTNNAPSRGASNASSKATPSENSQKSRS